jgi:opacity protein-like surface antigen
MSLPLESRREFTMLYSRLVINRRESFSGVSMIKKSFFAACLFVLTAAAFAADFEISAGGGSLLGANFTSSETKAAVLGPVTTTLAYDTKTFDAGAFMFADVTYAELSAAYLAEIGKVTGNSTTTGTIPGSPRKDNIDEDYVSHVFIADLLGKYPFVLNEKITIFPALGIGLKLPFAGNKFSDKEHDVTWGLAAKGGAGLDFSFTPNLFLRCETLYVYQFLGDKEAKIEQNVAGNPQTIDYRFKDSGYNLGVQVKIAVGYKILPANK